MTKILLVDDDLDVRNLIEHRLLDAGYAVDAAHTAAGARAFLDGDTYDLVFADAFLPDGSGLDIADEAQRRGMKTLVISGYASKLPRERLRLHEFMMKPVRPGQLLSVVRLTLGEQPG
jgi:DNA-binding NtrC family response regulator